MQAEIQPKLGGLLRHFQAFASERPWSGSGEVSIKMALEFQGQNWKFASVNTDSTWIGPIDCG